jgi:hypothetical protein
MRIHGVSMKQKTGIRGLQSISSYIGMMKAKNQRMFGFACNLRSIDCKTKKGVGKMVTVVSKSVRSLSQEEFLYYKPSIISLLDFDPEQAGDMFEEQSEE